MNLHLTKKLALQQAESIEEIDYQLTKIKAVDAVELLSIIMHNNNPEENFYSIWSKAKKSLAKHGKEKAFKIELQKTN